jgi:hypothetical protein
VRRRDKVQLYLNLQLLTTCHSKSSLPDWVLHSSSPAGRSNLYGGSLIWIWISISIWILVGLGFGFEFKELPLTFAHASVWRLAPCAHPLPDLTWDGWSAIPPARARVSPPPVPPGAEPTPAAPRCRPHARNPRRPAASLSLAPRRS